jgi:hypothetical protein
VSLCLIKQALCHGNMVSRGIAVLTLALDEGEWSSSCFRQFTPWYPLDRSQSQLLCGLRHKQSSNVGCRKLKSSKGKKMSVDPLDRRLGGWAGPRAGLDAGNRTQAVQHFAIVTPLLF